MRPTAKFSISFGLVTIPVAAYNATDTAASVSFVRIHTADGGRVRNQPVCSLEGTEVSADEIGRGYRTEDDAIVPLTDEDLDALPLPTARTLTILAFVAGGDIDPLQIGKGYYLGADSPAAAKPYALLRDAMERHRRVGLGKIALHGRETLAMIRPVQDMLVMQVLLWPHQIRPMTGVLPDRDVKVAANEVRAAETLMDSFGELSEEDVHDHYREALEEIVAAKLAHREPEFGAGEEAPAGQVMDLMAALQDSVRAAKRARGEIDEEAEETEETEEETAAGGRRTATKSAARKGTTARKTAKKTARTTAKTTAKAAAKTTAGAAKSGSAAGKKTAAAKSAGTKEAAGAARKTAPARQTAGRGRKAG
ncbi:MULTISPECIES: Ku protein [unclassified Streptomyces]|uniref:non-homologous end joining protein Ku n=1 Tax=unclassified Streptomyces TaxID=2593676 RepID=UPI0003738261|nr:MULTISPECIES: Ku protein [unclassified Streptomyces]MYT28860.1 Ku protein [Streptomyces sp. SID8354]